MKDVLDTTGWYDQYTEHKEIKMNSTRTHEEIVIEGIACIETLQGLGFDSADMNLTVIRPDIVLMVLSTRDRTGIKTNFNIALSRFDGESSKLFALWTERANQYNKGIYTPDITNTFFWPTRENLPYALETRNIPMPVVAN